MTCKSAASSQDIRVGEVADGEESVTSTRGLNGVGASKPFRRWMPATRCTGLAEGARVASRVLCGVFEFCCQLFDVPAGDVVREERMPLLEGDQPTHVVCFAVLEMLETTP